MLLENPNQWCKTNHLNCYEPRIAPCRVKHIIGCETLSIVFRLPCKSFVLSRSQLQFPVWLPDILMAGRQKTRHDTMTSIRCQSKIQFYNWRCKDVNPTIQAATAGPTRKTPQQQLHPLLLSSPMEYNLCYN